MAENLNIGIVQVDIPEKMRDVIAGAEPFYKDGGGYSTRRW